MKINVLNTDKVSAALESAQKGCRTRLCTYEELNKAVIEFTVRMTTDVGVARKWLNGLNAIINVNNQKFPNACHGIPEATYVRITFNSKDAYVTDIWRAMCNNKRFSTSLSGACDYMEALEQAAESAFTKGMFKSVFSRF